MGDTTHRAIARAYFDHADDCAECAASAAGLCDEAIQLRASWAESLARKINGENAEEVPRVD